MNPQIDFRQQPNGVPRKLWMQVLDKNPRVVRHSRINFRNDLNIQTVQIRLNRNITARRNR
jgi:hypothetical protein